MSFKPHPVPAGLKARGPALPRLCCREWAPPPPPGPRLALCLSCAGLLRALPSTSSAWAAVSGWTNFRPFY